MSILEDENILTDSLKQLPDKLKANELFWDEILRGTGAHGIETGPEFNKDLETIVSPSYSALTDSIKQHTGRPVYVLDCKTLSKYDAISWLEKVSKLSKSPTPILIIENITEIPEEDDVHDNQTYVENLLVHSWKNEINHFTDNRQNQNLEQFTLKPHDYLVFLTWTPDCAEKVSSVWKASDGLAWIGNLQEYKDKFISEYTKEDFTLLLNRHGLGFHFDNTKVVKGTHNLTISIYFENGKKLSTTQTVKFN